MVSAICFSLLHLLDDHGCLPVPVLQLREHRGGLVVDEAPASRPPGLPASALSGSLLPAVPPPGALGVLSPGGGCRGPTLGP